MSLKRSDSLVEYTKGMIKFRSNLVQPAKDKDNPFFKSKYVNLEGVQKAIDDALDGTGITYEQWPVNGENGKTGIGTIVLHESGEYIEFPPFFLKSEKNTPQGEGSVITYLRRYALSAIFGVTSDEDDDGSRASGNELKRNSNQPSKQPEPQKPQQPAQPPFKDFVKERYAEIKQLVPTWDNEKINELLKEKGKVDDLRKLTQSQMIGLLKETINEIKAHQNNSTQQKVAWGQ